MIILQVITRFDFGGAENYVRELSNELCDQANEVFIFSKKGRQLDLLNSNVKFITSCFFDGFVLLQAIQLIRIIRKRNIQVIHAHQRLPIVAACIASYFTRIPLVVTVHGRVRYDLRSKISRVVPSRIIFVSKKVLTVSRYYNQIAAKSVIIPNGISKFQNSYTYIPYGIGYISRVDSKHANVIFQLIDLIPKLSDEFNSISFSVFGDGDELEVVKARAFNVNKNLGRDAIKIYGFVEDLSTIEHFPELVLGVGRVAIESAMKGCSVISVNSKRMGEFVNLENYQFYFDNNFVNVNGIPPTVDSIHNSIINFFNNREANREVSVQLLKSIHTDYDIENVARKISTLYAQVIDDSKQSIG